MAIKLVFMMKKVVFVIEVVGREILYTDIYNTKKNLVPKLSKEELKQYDKAKTEEDIAQICIKDVERKGGKLIRRTEE